MQKEIEAKFLDVDHDAVRQALRAAGAVCEKPLRQMRRVTFDNATMKAKGGWIRVRDEGDKVTVTYKQVTELSADGVHEIETTTGSFDDMVAIFQAIELAGGSFQESRRETWRLGDVEVMLDEWPWLKPYIEIEGGSEAAIRQVAERLGFDWEQALFGDVMVAYRTQYPHLQLDDTVGDLPEVRFDAPPPDLLKP